MNTFPSKRPCLTRWIPCLLLFGFAQVPDARLDLPDYVTERDDVRAFRYDPAKLEVGRVYHYRHSNVDGTNASRVALFIAGQDRLEALKWDPRFSRSTLVLATMDWSTFSVRSFETLHVTASGRSSPIARLGTGADGQLEIEMGGVSQRAPIEHWPWHSYDFDLASLNVSMRFLRDPEGVLALGICDVVRGPGGPRFGFKGRVELRYVADEMRHGIPCRMYELNGEGLEDRGGFVWVAKGREAHFVGFEIELADEPGFDSGKLQLLELGQLSAQDWAEFVAASVR